MHAVERTSIKQKYKVLAGGATKCQVNPAPEWMMELDWCCIYTKH